MIRIDARPEHPTIVFLQDDETRYTVALDARTGTICGLKTGCPWPAPAKAVWDMAGAVVEYQRTRCVARQKS